MSCLGIGTLADETLDIIFAYLPFDDLEAVRRVCQRWKKVISRKDFQFWKKAYNKTVRFDYKIKDEYPLLMSSFLKRISDVAYHTPWSKHYVYLEYMVPQMVYRISQMFKSHLDKYEGIKNHRKYSWAAHVIQDRFRYFAVNKEGQVNNVAAIVVLCFIAKDVFDVVEIIKVVQTPLGSCTTINISELLYCIAKHLVGSRDYSFLGMESVQLVDQVPAMSRFCFLVQHALFYMEDDCWPSDAKYKDTVEIERIINLEINKKDSQVTKIVGFAGTGKTTALARLCEKNTHLKFLLVVFNESAKEHATGIFTKNVKCMTVNEMVRQMTGHLYSEKLTYKLSAKDKRKYEESNLDMENETNNQIIEAFVHSKDLQISKPDFLEDYEEFETPSKEKETLEKASDLWSAITDENDKSVPITEAECLKVWQVQKPSLQDVWKHDVLLVDEGHDMKGCFLDIVMSQETPKIIVGDPHQAMFSRSESYNDSAFEEIKAAKSFKLKQSFRYGPEIAFIADTYNELISPLWRIRNNDKHQLRHRGDKKVDRVKMEKTTSKDDIPGQTAFISLTSGELFDHVAKIVSEFESGSIKGYFIGGVESYSFKDLFEIQLLRTNEIKEWKTFKSCDELKAHYESIHISETTPNLVNLDTLEAYEMLRKVITVEKYGQALSTIMKRITIHLTDDPKEADYIYTTVCKAKGLEWDKVVLLDDFDYLMLEDMEQKSNLLYIALTRAKNQLTLNNLLKHSVYKNVNMFCEEIVHRPDHYESTLCKNCKLPLSQKDPFLLVVKTADDKYLCSRCSVIDSRVEDGQSYTDSMRVMRRYFTGPGAQIPEYMRRK